MFPREPHKPELRRGSVVSHLSEDILRQGGELTFDTTGSSMRWLIPSGSRVFVRGCGPGDVRFGDVVLVSTEAATRPGRFVLHRLIGLRGEHGERVLRTKGDCSPVDVTQGAGAQCLGRATRIIRADGVCDLDCALWRVLGVVAARLSLSVARQEASAVNASRRNPGAAARAMRTRLTRSVLKRVVLLGVALTSSAGTLRRQPQL
jgi:hypothetical protein